MTAGRADIVATELDDAGCGVGAAAGKRVHVADLLPGERAEVAIDHASPHRAEAWARIIRRVGEPSSERVAPPCPAFGRCGGCAWQHLAYDAQLAAKRTRVEAAVAAVPAVASGAVTVAAVRPSVSITGYRNKGKYVACRDATGRLLLGAYAPRTHHVIDTIGCRVVAPIIDEVASWVRGAAEEAELTVYDEATRAGDLRYVVVREAGGDVLIALVHASDASRERLRRVASAMAKHPAVRGVIGVSNDRRDGAIVPSGSAIEVLFGERVLVEQLAGVGVEVGAGEFVQINRAQAQAMYARIVELADAGPGLRALDLYAGLGGIGLSLARAGASVVAVERDRDAVAALGKAAARAQLPLVAVAADAGDLGPARGELLPRPNVVVVNPPRKGLDAGARALLAELAAPTLIYVSCGPESLGRDLVALAALGYAPDAIEPFDLMPGTAQIETVVRLRRG